MKIADPPAAIIRKKVGDHVELTCEASGSPPPVIQWYRRNQRLTEVSFLNHVQKNRFGGGGGNSATLHHKYISHR